ncbi:MAG TPA: LysE family translocator [Gemmatimonadaceae bacterium]|nr:LysE family translocator [Gemmatimonadaceae bacterium]
MPSGATFLRFGAAALVLLLIPGPAVLYIVARSMAQGRRAGLVSVMGTCTGAMVHVLAATLGLSALLVASAAAFAAIKWLGAAYLIYLGLRTIFSTPAIAAPDSVAPRPVRRLYLDGVVVTVLNPKTGLFFLAFLPQFIDRARGSIAGQSLALGLTFVGLAIFTDGAYALLAGSAHRLVSPGKRAKTSLRYASGVTYVGLGIGAALTRK